MPPKNLNGNSYTYKKLDDAFSEIEEELENKLWELYDKILSKKNA